MLGRQSVEPWDSENIPLLSSWFSHIKRSGCVWIQSGLRFGQWFVSKDCVVLALSCPNLSRMSIPTHYKEGFLKPFTFDQPASVPEKMRHLCPTSLSTSLNGDPTTLPTQLEGDSSNLFKGLHQPCHQDKSLISNIQVFRDLQKMDFNWSLLFYKIQICDRIRFRQCWW